MYTVEALRINTVELPHPLCQIGFRRFDQEVVVIAHLAPGVTHPIETLANLGKNLQPNLAVSVRQVNIFPPVSPRGDVV
jgi:hypothetical protein